MDPKLTMSPDRSLFPFLYHYQIHVIKMYWLYIIYGHVYTYIDTMSFQAYINHHSGNENYKRH